MKTRLASLTGLAAVAVAASLSAQTPRGAASADVGGHKISIDYGRPALKGRALDELLKQLPPDRMWRAGENRVTTLSTEGALEIGGKTVPAGKYSVYVHAGEGGEWFLVLNEDLGMPLGEMWDQAPDNLKNEPWPHLGDYEKTIAGKEVARARMSRAKTSPTDLFTISLTPKGTAADLTLAWGDQAWSVPIQPAK